MTASNGGSLIGAIVCLISAGGAVGVIASVFEQSRSFSNLNLQINAYVNDIWGRRAGFLSAGVFTIIGVGLISGSVNLSEFFAQNFS